MTRYRVRTVPVDGRPQFETVDAGSVEEALEHVRGQGGEVVSVELADGEPLQYEPAGPMPPHAPRQIPPGVKGAAGGFVLAIVGGIFVAISSVFILIGLVMVIAGNKDGVFFSLFPLIHFTVGMGLAGYAWKSRARRRRIYQGGMAATATIDRSGRQRSVRVNGRNPYQIEWTFYIDDHRFHGKRASMNRRVADIEEGDRLWVLYDPEDPTKSVEWPPL